MSLGWKDIAATALTASAMVITYAKLKGFDWPFLGSWRVGTLILLVVGLGTCILVGSGGVPLKDTWTTVASILGGLAFVLAIAGLIINSRVIFITLAVDVVALWIVATLHHLVTGAA